MTNFFEKEKNIHHKESYHFSITSKKSKQKKENGIVAIIAKSSERKRPK